MKNIVLSVLIMLVTWGVNAQERVFFDEYFEDATLRVDCIRKGCKRADTIMLSKYVKKDGPWAGSRKTLLDPFDNGEYRVLVKDALTGKELYSKCYNNLFREYVDTPEGDSVVAQFEEVMLIPWPKWRVEICMQHRDTNQRFVTQATFEFDGSRRLREGKDYKRVKSGSLVKKIIDNGDVHHKVDVVIVAQGYSAKDKMAMERDMRKFADYMLSEEPFASRKSDFNVWGVSGNAGAKYNTFGADRYLMTEKLFDLHDLLNEVPYDHIIIMVNNTKYGGGAIYNFYAVSSLNEMANMVLPHELGHSIGGLADEYVDPNLSYGDMHKKTIEPTEPNITTLVDFESKWKDMLPENVEIPTKPVKGLSKRDCGPIGVYEGGGYQAKGIYRPVTNCMMNHYAHFCPVCSKRLEAVIDALCK